MTNELNDGRIMGWLGLDKTECPQTPAELRARWEHIFAPKGSFAGFECPSMWVEPVHIALHAIHLVDPETKIGQVKSKWGGLRIYLDKSEGLSDDKSFLLNLIVSWAEMECESISARLKREAQAKENQE